MKSDMKKERNWFSIGDSFFEGIRFAGGATDRGDLFGISKNSYL
jgi:hypothetical protein